jgi:hypothetical protein
VNACTDPRLLVGWQIEFTYFGASEGMRVVAGFKRRGKKLGGKLKFLLVRTLPFYFVILVALLDGHSSLAVIFD